MRLLPAVDKLLLAHADRTHIMTDEHRRRVCDGAVVEPTVQVDGLSGLPEVLTPCRSGAYPLLSPTA